MVKLDYTKFLVDELIYMRERYRSNSAWKESDEIRDYLDSRHIFVFDTKDGQIIYHRNHGTRDELIIELNKDKNSEKRFDAWLFSQKAKH